MNYNDCKELLSRVHGCTFAAMDTETVPNLKGGKANPFQGKLSKIAKGHRVMLFSNTNANAYCNKVRRELEKEGKNPDSFQLGKLPWGVRIEDSPFIENKGKYYLQCVFLESGDIEYRASEFIDCENGTWFAKGERVPETAIEGLNEKSGSEHQGLSKENEVIVRTFSLDSIKELRAFGEQLN